MMNKECDAIEDSFVWEGIVKIQSDGKSVQAQKQADRP